MIHKYYEIAVPICAATLVGVFAPPNFFESSSSELIAFFSIQAAAILPVMVFAAGILRPGGLKIDTAKRLQAAIESQMKFWFNSLVCNIFAVVSVILANLFSYKLILNIPVLGICKDISGFWGILIACLASYAVIRVIKFREGVVSLVSLNGQLVMGEIQAKNDNQASRIVSQAEPFSVPSEYGERIDS